MKNIVTALVISLCSLLQIQAQTPVEKHICQRELRGGIRLQKAQKLYWENGIAFDYASSKLANHKIHLGAGYVTTRLGSAMGSNAIKQDNFVVSGAYHFRSRKPLQPFARLNTGYFHADYEKAIFDDIPNTALLLSVDGGLYYNFKAPFTASLSAGYNLNTGSGSSGPGTLYPVFYQMTIYYTLLKSK